MSRPYGTIHGDKIMLRMSKTATKRVNDLTERHNVTKSRLVRLAIDYGLDKAARDIREERRKTTC